VGNERTELLIKIIKKAGGFMLKDYREELVLLQKRFEEMRASL